MQHSSRIAIIGWGSLIWDLDNLAPCVTGDWHMSAGPRLPMEFSRVSAKRKQALAVCLDPDDGEACATHVILSRREGLENAVQDLAARERAPLDRIGGLCLRTGTRSGGRAPLAEIVAAWCEAGGWTGAVWTDLRPNFEEQTGQRFTLGAAEAYLTTLGGESRDEAVRYIENAPATTDTPLRRQLSGQAWWQGEAARLRGAGQVDSSTR